MHDCIATAFSIRSGNQSPHRDAERYLSLYDASPRGSVVRMTNGVNTLRAVKTSVGSTSRLRQRCRTDVAALVRRPWRAGLRCRGHACDPPDSAQESIALRARITGFSFCSLGRPASRRAPLPAQHVESYDFAWLVSFYRIRTSRKVSMFGIIVRIRLR